MTIITRSTSQIQHIIFVKKYIIISSQSNLAVVIISSDLSLNHNFLFEFSCHQANVTVYIHIVDHTMSKVYIQNNSDLSLIISQKFYMNQVVKYKAEDCYLVNAEDFILILRFWWLIWQKWIQKVMQNLLVTIAVFYTSMNRSFFFEHRLFNDITIYDVSNMLIKIEIIISDYSI